MLVGALADAGADQAAITAAIASLESGAVVSFEKVKRSGIGATKYHVRRAGDSTPTAICRTSCKMIEKADIPERARAATPSPFSALGEAEAEVHQVPIEKVHFHEVGAADSIADIVGACVAFDLLGRRHHRLLAAQRGQRHGEDRARHAAGSRAGHGAAARRTCRFMRAARRWS